MVDGVLIANGRTAEVYDRGDGKILKLFYDWAPHEWVKYEFDIGFLLNSSGVPAPKVYETVNIDGRQGIIYQKVEGKTLLNLIQEKPWKVIGYSRLLARLQSEVHMISEKGLVAQNDRFSHAILDSSQILGKRTGIILDYLTGLKGKCALCHGDLHPDNILVSNDKSVIIDWMNAYFGDPLGDVARTCLMIRSPYVRIDTTFFKKILILILQFIILKVYKSEYMKMSKIDNDQIEDFMLPVASARLREKIPGEKEWLLKLIDKKLKCINSKGSD